MEKEKIFRDYLIAPKRKSYGKDKANWKEDCIFCAAAKKIKDDSIKAPAVIKLKGTEVFLVADFDHNMLVVNPYPYVPRGHLEIAPKRHMKDYDELREEEVDEIFKKIIPAAKKVLTKEYEKEKIIGFNIGINIGVQAGGTIEHFHVHVVPRFPKEVGWLETTASTKIMDEDAKTTMLRLAKHFKRK